MIQKRLFAVYLSAVSTYTYKEIGFICGLHPRTVSHYIALYQQQGYEGLLTNNYGTNKSELENHKDAILDTLCRGSRPSHCSRHGYEAKPPADKNFYETSWTALP